MKKYIVVYGKVSEQFRREILNQIEKANEQNYFMTCDSIFDSICDAIQNASEQNADGESKGTYKYEGNGSTSYCYSLYHEGRPTIIKEFRPSQDVKECIKFAPKNRCDLPKCGFAWITEAAKKDSKKVVRFLHAFERYLKQNEMIDKIIASLKEQNVGNFVNPELYLSSIGLIYKCDEVPGATLKTKLEKNEYGTDFSIATIAHKLRILLKVTKSVGYYHNKKIFNGDLKPSNLYILDEGEDVLTVRNIDYDTCVDTETMTDSSDFKDLDLRTTRAFYPIEGINCLENLAQKDISLARNKLLNLDVAALGNIFIYMFLNDQQRKEIQQENSSTGFDLAYQYFGFNIKIQGISDMFFNGLNCSQKLAGLAIFKEIQALIANSVLATHEDRIGIEEFINRLNLIIAYLDCIEDPEHINDYLKNEKEPFNNDIPKVFLIYFANLLRLDNMITTQNIPFRLEDDVTVQYEYSHNPQKNTPEDYIQKIFYEE